MSVWSVNKIQIKGTKVVVSFNGVRGFMFSLRFCSLFITENTKSHAPCAPDLQTTGAQKIGEMSTDTLKEAGTDVRPDATIFQADQPSRQQFGFVVTSALSFLCEH